MAGLLLACSTAFLNLHFSFASKLIWICFLSYRRRRTHLASNILTSSSRNITLNMLHFPHTPSNLKFQILLDNPSCHISIPRMDKRTAIFSDYTIPHEKVKFLEIEKKDEMCCGGLDTNSVAQVQWWWCWGRFRRCGIAGVITVGRLWDFIASAHDQFAVSALCLRLEMCSLSSLLSCLLHHYRLSICNHNPK